MTIARNGTSSETGAWRDAMLWAIPALLAGAWVRILLVSYLPLATLRPDSDSYLSFAYRFLLDGDIALYAKRRYVYPIALLPLCAVPGVPLAWIAWAQHLAGLLTVLPLAYIARVTLPRWRLWIVPLTLVWSLFPMAVWYEHEVLADAPFANLFLCAFAGWVFWIRNRAAPASWWPFFTPFALCVLTKPAGKFLWPVLAVAFLAWRGWRGWRPTHAISLVVVLVLSAIQGDPYMAARHLFMSTLPALPLETPLHAGLKAELAPLVEQARAELPIYHDADERAFLLVRKGGGGASAYPLWNELLRDERLSTQVMKDLAREALFASPATLAWVTVQRIAAAANPSTFDERAFLPAYSREETAEALAGMARQPEKAARVIPFLFGLGSVPSLEIVAAALARIPADGTDGKIPDRLRRLAKELNSRLALLSGERYLRGRPQPLKRMLPPTLLGWAVVGGGLTALLRRRHRPTLGLWFAVSAVYLTGVYAVASAYPRFFLPVWPVLLLALCALGETLMDLAAAVLREAGARFRARG